MAVGRSSTGDYFDGIMAAHQQVAEATGAARGLRRPRRGLRREPARRWQAPVLRQRGQCRRRATHRHRVRREDGPGALAAIALGTDTSALTAAGNDFGFETIFARQVEALGRPETKQPGAAACDLRSARRAEVDA